MNGDRSYTGAAGKISNQWRSNCFLKIETEGAMTRCAGSLFLYFTTRAEKAQLLRRRRLGLCSNRYACPRRPARGGRRKNSAGLRSTSPLKILKARMRSARRRLRSSEKRLSWRRLSSYGTWWIPLTSRDGDLLLAELAWGPCQRSLNVEYRSTLPSFQVLLNR